MHEYFFTELDRKKATSTYCFIYHPTEVICLFGFSKAEKEKKGFWKGNLSVCLRFIDK